MRVYEQIKNMLCDELEDIAKQKELDPHTMEMLDETVDILKDIKEIEAMESSYPSQGYARDGGYSEYWGRMPIYMYDNGMQGNSYARGGADSGRNSQGRYGYSGDTKEELYKLMESAKTERDKEAIRNALDNMR